MGTWKMGFGRTQNRSGETRNSPNKKAVNLQTRRASVTQFHSVAHGVSRYPASPVEPDRTRSQMAGIRAKTGLPEATPKSIDAQCPEAKVGCFPILQHHLDWGYSLRNK